MTDAALVDLARADPTRGMAAIYDRYGTSLYNYCYSILRSQADAGDALQESFVTAMDKLSQLRDPDKLRPWLYAIARNQCFKAHRLRNRERPEDPFDADDQDRVVAAMAAEPSSTELVALVWEATAGLSDMDRSVLELHIRHELDGEELAESLGVAGPKCSVLLHRAKERLRTAVGALIVSKVGATACGDLDAIVSGAEFNPLIRKRVARHIKTCDVCEKTEQRHRPEAYLAAMPLLPVPSHIRDGVLAAIESGAGVGAAESAPIEGRLVEHGPASSSTVASDGAHRRSDSELTAWNRAGFPELDASHLAQAGVSTSRPMMAAATVLACIAGLLVLLMTLNPLRPDVTLVAGPAPRFLPTTQPAPQFLATVTPTSPTVAAAGRADDRELPAPLPAPTPSPEPTMTTPAITPPVVQPTATAAPSPAAVPSPTATAAPSPTAVPSPTATAFPSPTATAVLSTPTPTPTVGPGGGGGLPDLGQNAVTPGPVVADFTSPSITTLDVGCGDPFTITVVVADDLDPDPVVDLDVTWDDEADPAMPMTRLFGTTYRATVPRSELDGERIDFFVRGSLQDGSGNNRNVDRSEGCTIIG